jgi:predicted PurR-regulated permease PerM
MKLSNNQIEVIAGAIGILAVIPILGTIIWAILVLIFGLSISWAQVVGGIIILDLLRSLILFRNK